MELYKDIHQYFNGTIGLMEIQQKYALNAIQVNAIINDYLSSIIKNKDCELPIKEELLCKQVKKNRLLE